MVRHPELQYLCQNREGFHARLPAAGAVSNQWKYRKAKGLHLAGMWVVPYGAGWCWGGMMGKGRAVDSPQSAPVSSQGGVAPRK